MKELTIEQKAQRYDEAYKVAESIHRFSSNPVEIKRMEEIFSELKESEDERIRKQIIYAIEELHVCDETKRKCIAWLEKQGEHANFLSKIQVGDKVTRNEDGELVNLSQLNRVAKPAEEYNITGIKSRNAQGKLGEMIKNLKSALSEEDEIRLDRICKTLWKNRKGDTDEIYQQEQDVNWLKSLKGRVRPKQEWSEEDEKNINFLCELLTDLQVKSTENEIKHGTNSRSEYYYNIKKWLKSLKDRYTWKPSEEQMQALNNLNLTGGISYTGQGQTLIELYNDLKKL